MTRDEIIRMAKQCGIPEFEGNESQAENILRFAALVAAAERKACAKEAEYEAARWPYAPEVREPCEEIAKAITARGEK